MSNLCVLIDFLTGSGAESFIIIKNEFPNHLKCNKEDVPACGNCFKMLLRLRINMDASFPFS